MIILPTTATNTTTTATTAPHCSNRQRSWQKSEMK